MNDKIKCPLCGGNNCDCQEPEFGDEHERDH